MANESGPMLPNGISQQAVDAVRGALERSLRDVGEPTEDVRCALNGLVREARERGVPPEQLLVVLKRLWYGLPEIRVAEPASDQARILQRVVTMCIKEYFAD
jgi:hypothetical protein